MMYLFFKVNLRYAIKSYSVPLNIDQIRSVRKIYLAKNTYNSPLGVIYIDRVKLEYVNYIKIQLKILDIHYSIS